MTFNEIAIKNFKGNMKRYISYFLCNSFAIMIFFMYSTLVFNDKLLNSPQVDKKVLEAIIIPNVGLITFSIFFITYSHSAFIKGRKKEFGLFMNLGMSIRDIRKIILVENGLIALASITLGILSGTIFSRLFFLFIMRAINVTGVNFQIGFKNYLFSIGIFVVIFAFSVLVTLIVTSSFQIIDLLKSDRVSRRNKISSSILGITGLIMLIGSMISLYMDFNKNPHKDGVLLLCCTIICAIGLYITISQLGSSILKFTKKKINRYYFNNLVSLTSLNYKFKETKKIIFCIAIMVMVSIFYSGHCLNLYLSAEKTANECCPYDLAFEQTANKNNISLNEINNLINTSKNSVTEHKSLEFIEYYNKGQYYAERDIIISAEKINKITNSDFHVNKGSYIKLIQLEDLSEDEKNNCLKSDKIYRLGNKIYMFKIQESDFKVLFNRLSYLGNEFIILNNKDYNELKSNTQGIEVGEIQLINFKDWKKTANVVYKLKEKMKFYNKTTHKSNIQEDMREEYSENIYLNTTSKIELYNYNRQGGSLMFYLITFIGIFFFIATCITLYVKLFSDVENEKKKYKKLFKVGITEKEIRKNIAREMRVLFFVGPVIGIIIALVYTSVFYKGSGMYLEGFTSDLIISSIYMAFQIFYYFACKRKYGNEIIESLS